MKVTGKGVGQRGRGLFQVFWTLARSGWEVNENN